MTRKDYVLIAEALADTARELHELEVPDTALFIAAEHLADRLEEDNPRFDRRRFLDYALPLLQP